MVFNATFNNISVISWRQNKLKKLRINQIHNLHLGQGAHEIACVGNVLLPSLKKQKREVIKLGYVLLKEVYIGTKKGIIKLGYSSHRPILSWLFPFLQQSNINPIGLSQLGYSPLFVAIKHSSNRPILAWLFPFLQQSNIHPIGLSQLGYSLYLQQSTIHPITHRPILAWLFPFLQQSNIQPIGLS